MGAVDKATGHAAEAHATSAAADRAAAARAASQLEAMFLRRMLGEMNVGGGGLDGGFAGDTFREMFNGAIADSMAKAGGIGLAKSLEKSLLSDPSAKITAARATRLDAHDALATATATPLRVRRAYGDDAPSFPNVAPVDLATAETSSHFGPRAVPIPHASRFHEGIDLAAPAGAPVRSAAPGVVTYAGWARGYGNLVVIDHGNGVETRYGHLARTHVSPGQEVTAGDRVGDVGATGRATGAHLHFEERKGGHAVDPESTSAPLKIFPSRPNRASGG